MCSDSASCRECPSWRRSGKSRWMRCAGFFVRPICQERQLPHRRALPAPSICRNGSGRRLAVPWERIGEAECPLPESCGVCGNWLRREFGVFQFRAQISRRTADCYIEIEGLAPEKNMTDQDQLDGFAASLARETQTPLQTFRLR